MYWSVSTSGPERVQRTREGDGSKANKEKGTRVEGVEAETSKAAGAKEEATAASGEVEEVQEKLSAKEGTDSLSTFVEEPKDKEPEIPAKAETMLALRRNFLKADKGT